MINRSISSTLLIAVVATMSSSCTVGAFSKSYTSIQYQSRESSISLRAADTDSILPSFNTGEEYTSYLKSAGQLPSGFAVGTATGEFVSVEAPAMGKLPIKATVIHLTEGPTDSWAAVFTSNKVCFLCVFCMSCFVL